MSTPIENNTAELEALLQIATDLPTAEAYETWEGGSY